MIVTRVYLGVSHGFDDILGNVARSKNLTVPALEAKIFLGGDHDGAVTTIAGDDHGLAQSCVLIAPDFLAKFSGGNAEHSWRTHLPDNPDYS